VATAKKYIITYYYLKKRVYKRLINKTSLECVPMIFAGKKIVITYVVSSFMFLFSNRKVGPTDSSVLLICCDAISVPSLF
jgi:hypothetical protein